MFRPDRGVKYVAYLQYNGFLHTLLSVSHLYLAIEHDEYFLAVVHVPFVGLVGPVQACGDAIHVGDIQCAPGTLGGEAFTADDVHGRSVE
ncbi:hypothetical protein D3C73_1025880 [compost metagenome]